MLQPDLLDKLVSLRQQQEASLRNIERLRDEHKDWQTCFDALLASITHTNNDGLQQECDIPTAKHPEISPRSPLKSIELPAGDVESIPSEETGAEPQRSVPLSPVAKLRRSIERGPLHKLVQQELQQVKQTFSEVQPRCSSTQQKITRMVHSSYFELVTGFVIFANLITIGLEAQLSLMYEEEFPVFSWPWFSERIFLTIYCGELLMRRISGASLFDDFWFFIDACLVFVGILALVVMPLTVGEIADIGAEKLLLVRGVRLLRLVRALRMFKHFKVMWRLVNGLLTAGKTLLSTSVLILVSLFIFACVAVELIAKDPFLVSNPATAHIVRRHFWGIELSMATLMQFVTLDSAASIYFPIILERPWLCVYFLIILFVISIGLMNLVTAVVLENAMESAAEEAEEERSSLKSKVKEALPDLIHIFETLDKDGSGILTRDEMDAVDENLLPRRLLNSACVQSIVDFFDFLDVEEKGELTQQEFVESLLNLCLLEMPVSAIQTLKLLHMLVALTKKIDQNVQVLRSSLTQA